MARGWHIKGALYSSPYNDHSPEAAAHHHVRYMPLDLPPADRQVDVMVTNGRIDKVVTMEVVWLMSIKYVGERDVGESLADLPKSSDQK